MTCNYRNYDEDAKVELVWATPDIDGILAFIARVSNVENQNNPNIKGLISYMLRENHVSPFDMANVTFSIDTTRDIGRQMLRHHSIRPQEFSQRYANVSTLGDFVYREFRTQHPTNRQLSVDVPEDDPRHKMWKDKQEAVLAAVVDAYTWAIANGGAKEVARVVLPEGLTPSRLYMNGTLRSWIHYCQGRVHESTQKEHRIIAEAILDILRKLAPLTISAVFD